MNKNILLGSLVVVLVVALAGFILMKDNNIPTATEKSVEIEKTATTSVTPSASKTTSVKLTSTPTATFTNILPKLGNYQCDYESVSQSSRTTNTVYLSDGKMRAEFRTTGYSATISNIMVYDGVNLYTWVEGQSVGSVTHPKSLSDFPSIIPKDLVAAKSLGSGLNSVSWNCHAWTVDKTMLVKPSYLKI